MSGAELRTRIGGWIVTFIAAIPQLLLLGIILYALMFLLYGCRAQQVIDTSQTQTETRDAAQSLEHFPGPDSRLTPHDQALVDHARITLTECADSLQRTTEAANRCQADLKSIQDDLEKLQAKYDAEAGWWARIKGFFSMVRYILIFVGIAYLAGWILPPSRIIEIIAKIARP